ncbi:Uncharacterised protein [Shigella sonnei]|uniref:Uncharacterized protein n=1 Tax=Salmonella enterica I TaxID=59201 RepID=A0A410J977_SALET|nr:hypothetical protein [Salmonella enterica subsp. enterica]CSL43659.1 Uncharacterised protein [Shigella sonnei]SWO70359.1 Uncharacterised protein [Klebsiella pneumoniae]CSM32152.1 Uncharacterised protein [Shigella sonnei]CSM86398.1 Uncharacterised protein [Shigella sonnei]
MKTSPSAESGRRADRLLPRRGESPFCRPLLRGFSPQWTFPMGQRLPRHGAVVRGQTQKFLTLAAKSFVAGTSLPWTAETCCGRFSPRKVHSGETGRRGGGGRADNCAIRRSFLTHRQVCRERRSRRDRGGATGTVAASLVFQTSDRSGSPKPRQRVRRRLAGAPAAACRSRA